MMMMMMIETIYRRATAVEAVIKHWERKHLNHFANDESSSTRQATVFKSRNTISLLLLSQISRTNILWRLMCRFSSQLLEVAAAAVAASVIMVTSK